MGNVSAKKTKDKALLALETQRRSRIDFQTQLEERIEAETQGARELLRAKNKDRAVLALKRRKMQQELLQKANSLSINVEQQLANVEWATKQQEVFDSLKAGNQALKSIQSQLSLDDAEMLMDDTAEATAYQEELNATFGDDISAQDEEAVLAEFDSLEAQIIFEELPPPPVAVPRIA